MRIKSNKQQCTINVQHKSETLTLLNEGKRNVGIGFAASNSQLLQCHSIETQLDNSLGVYIRTMAERVVNKAMYVDYHKRLIPVIRQLEAILTSH